MSKGYAAARQHPFRAAGFMLIAIAVAISAFLVYQFATQASTAVGGFEIESCFSTAVPPTPIPCESTTPALGTPASKIQYYSGNDTFGIGGAGDDWAQGAANQGVFGVLTGTATPPAGATVFPNCYGSTLYRNPSFDSGAQVALMCDGFGKDIGTPAPEQNIVSPSGKIPDDVWPIKAGSLGVPKDDLTHGYYVQKSAEGCATSSDNIVIVGMERANNEGDNHWGIELDKVRPFGLVDLANAGPTATVTPFNLDFNRSPGDVFISVDLTKGGGQPSITVFVAPPGTTTNSPTNWTTATAVPCTNPNHVSNTTATNIQEQLAPPWNTIACDPTISDNGANSCRLANGTGGSNVCGTHKTPVNCTAIPPRDFVEVAIDLNAYGIDQSCFGSVLLTSRSSPSGGGDLGTADVKDITAAVLPGCHLTINKNDSDGNPLAGATFTISPNPLPPCPRPAGSSLVVADNYGQAGYSGADENNAPGVVEISGICPATYTVTESVAPPGYSKDPDGSNPADCTISASNISCVFTFVDPLGTLTVNKQDAGSTALAGASFKIEPNPYWCHSDTRTGAQSPTALADGSLTVADDYSGDAVPTTDDRDTSAGVVKLDNVCIGSYTVTETVAPPGYSKDPDGSTPGTCDVTDTSDPATDQKCSITFHDPLGTLTINKQDTGTTALAGASFSISPNPYWCHSDTRTGAQSPAAAADGSLSVTDDYSGDAVPTTDDRDTSGGVVKLDNVCIGSYTVTESSPPPGYSTDPDGSDPATCSVTDTTDPTTDQKCSVTFHDPLGTLFVEKVDSQDLTKHLPGAKFLIEPNPYWCHSDTRTGTQSPDAAADGSLSVTDDYSGDAVPSGDDQDTSGGFIKLDHVCTGNYQVTETDPPLGGYNIDSTDPKDCDVLETSDPATDQTCSVTFTDSRGSLVIRKEAKNASTDATNDLLGGASFKITPDPTGNAGTCTDGTPDCLDVTDGSAPDVFATAGMICINDVVVGQTYTITETAAPTNYLKDPTPSDPVSPVNDTCANLADTAGSEADVTPAWTFQNTPLSSIEILFKSLAGDGVTKAHIECVDENGDPVDPNSENGAADPAFDDTDETYGNGTSGLVPGTYTCTVVIDP